MKYLTLALLNKLAAQRRDKARYMSFPLPPDKPGLRWLRKRVDVYVQALDDKYWRAFKAHDNMYGTTKRKKYRGIKTRKQADGIMIEYLDFLRCPAWQRWIMWGYVRAWCNNRWSDPA